MYNTNIEKDTVTNNLFRKVIFTSDKIQLVLMSLNVGENIPEEIHENIDQFFRIEKGKGKFIISEKIIEVTDGDCVIIKAGTKHEVKNIGNEELKMYTIYTPPNHPNNTIDERLNDAVEREEIFEKLEEMKTKASKYKKKYLKLIKLINCLDDDKDLCEL